MKIAFAKVGRPKKGAVVASVLDGCQLSPTAAAAVPSMKLACGSSFIYRRLGPKLVT